MTKKSPPPKYRHQKSRNLAVVRIHGKDHYLGEYGSPASKQLYAQLIAEKWLDVPANIEVRSSTQKHWCPCPTDDRRPENGGRNAKTGGKMNGRL